MSWANIKRRTKKRLQIGIGGIATPSIAASTILAILADPKLKIPHKL